MVAYTGFKPLLPIYWALAELKNLDHLSPMEWNTFYAVRCSSNPEPSPRLHLSLSLSLPEPKPEPKPEPDTKPFTRSRWRCAPSARSSSTY
mgnify:CR=1 FL=1